MPIDKQAIFDKVIAHLKQQGRPALDPINGSCRYRNEDGLKCAIGALIPDEAYSVALENTTPYTPKVREACGFSGLSDDEIEFLGALQNIHDFKSSQSIGNWQKAWPEEAESVASSYGLTYNG